LNSLEWPAGLGKLGPAADANRERDFGTLPGLVEPGKKK